MLDFNYSLMDRKVNNIKKEGKSMLKMSFPVIVSSVRGSKDGKSFYAEFNVSGGQINLPVDASHTEKLKSIIGTEKVLSFEMKPRNIVVYERPITVFEPCRFLGIEVAAGINPLPKA